MKLINSDKYLDVTKNVSSIAQDKSQSDCKKWIPHICCCIQRQTWSFLQWSWVSQKKFAVKKVHSKHKTDHKTSKELKWSIFYYLIRMIDTDFK